MAVKGHARTATAPAHEFEQGLTESLFFCYLQTMLEIDWNQIHASGKEYTPMPEGLVDAMLKEAGNPKTVLDIACGTGDLVVKLARRGLAVTGVDVSRVALDKAKEKLVDAGISAVLTESDFNAPDFGKELSGPFDLVVIRLSLAFVDDKDVFLGNVKNLLSDKGAFICTTPVLFPGQTYDDRQSRISILEPELEKILKRHFLSVSILIDDEVNRPQWPLRTYRCSF